MPKVGKGGISLDRIELWFVKQALDLNFSIFRSVYVGSKDKFGAHVPLQGG